MKEGWIVCTCGHKVKSLDDNCGVKIKDNEEISYLTLCKKCLISYIKLDIVIEAHNERFSDSDLFDLITEV